MTGVIGGVAAVLLAAPYRPVHAAALVPDGQYWIEGPSPLGVSGADRERLDVSEGHVRLVRGCGATTATLRRTGARQVEAVWASCGAATDLRLLLEPERGGREGVRGSLQATRDDARVERPIRARRLEAVESTIVPQPVAVWRLAGERRLLLRPSTSVVVEPARAEVLAVAEQLATLLRARGVALGPVLPRAAMPVPEGAILLTTEDADPALGREGYTLHVAETGAVLRAPTPAGLLYAVQSLRQVLPVELDGPAAAATWELPPLLIDDAPRFVWRGFMLDVSRTFYPIATLRRWVDLLALHKLNVFHLHLTDDQGWRIESEAFPALHTQGSAFDPVRAPGEVGGYYTRSELADLVAYAAARNVEIVPEIDVPGHTLALLHAMPELGCEQTPGVPRRSSEFPIVPWGMTAFPFALMDTPTLCVCDTTTFTVMARLLDEVTAIFPSRWIHLGGDEVSLTDFANGYLCTDVVRTERLDGVADLPAWFFHRLEALVRGRGRTLIAWDEVHEGERPERPSLAFSSSFTTMHWRERYAPPTLLDRDVVQVVGSPLYLDLVWVPAARTYAYDPIPASATPAQAAHVLGVQGAMWTHLARTQAEVDRQVFPKLGAIAEVGWTPPERKSWDGFVVRWARHAGRLDRLGVAR